MAYLKFPEYTNLTIGDTLTADGGFDCMGEGERKKVFMNKSGELCVNCTEGEHNLIGQLNDKQEVVGLYFKSEQNKN